MQNLKLMYWIFYHCSKLQQKSINFAGASVLGRPFCARCVHPSGCHANITVYPKKYAHGFCFAGLCCSYTLTDFPISNRLTSLALWQSNDCPSASKATLMNMDKYFMWIHYERLHNHNKAKHNKTVCIFLGIYCTWSIVCNSVPAIRLADSVLGMWFIVVNFQLTVYTRSDGCHWIIVYITNYIFKHGVYTKCAITWCLRRTLTVSHLSPPWNVSCFLVYVQGWWGHWAMHRHHPQSFAWLVWRLWLKLSVYVKSTSLNLCQRSPESSLLRLLSHVHTHMGRI